jgi:hypothetical protein
VPGQRKPGFVGPVVSKPGQVRAGDPNFIGPVATRPGQVKAGDPNFIGPVATRPGQPKAGDSAAAQVWDFMKPSKLDGVFGAVGAAQGALSGVQDRASQNEGQAGRFHDFGLDRQAVANDPTNTPDVRRRAAHDAVVAGRREERYAGAAAKQLGPVASVIPENVRSTVTRTPWDTLQDSAKAAGKELGPMAKIAKPIAEGTPYVGAIVTGVQTGLEVAGGKSWGRSLAEGAGSLVGGALGAAAAGALATPESAGLATIPAAVAGGTGGSYLGGKLADLATDGVDNLFGIEH